MTEHATENKIQHNHSGEGQCPEWCVAHERYDVGHPTGEGLVHLGRERRSRNHTFQLRRDQLLRERRGVTSFWLDDDEMTPAQAKQLGMLLIETASGGGSVSD